MTTARTGREGALGPERAAAWLLAGLLAILLLRLTAIAWRLPLDYWDGFEYLMNARALAGHDLARLSFGYIAFRPPLVPLLIAPVLAGYAPAGGGTALRGPHLLALALAMLSLVAVYRLLRLTFGRLESLLGSLLLAVNPVFIRYAPFVMTDIPATLFVTLGGVGYLQARRRSGALPYACAAVAFATAILAKYSAVFVLGAVGLLEVLRATLPGGTVPARGRLRSLLTDVRPALVVAASFVLVYLVHVAVFARVLPGTDTLGQLRDTVAFTRAAWGTPFGSDPIFEYALALTVAFSPPLIVIALLGMLIAARRRTDVDLFCLAWFWVFFAVITWVVGHKETRYALPLFPPLVYFVVRGLCAARDAVARGVERLLAPGWSDRLARAVAGLALVPLGFQPVRLAVHELRRFDDPVYTRPFLSEVARWTLAHVRPDQRVLIERDFVYTMYPADPLFLRYDEFYYLHHIGHPALVYLLDRRVELTARVPVRDGDGLALLTDQFATSEVLLTSGSPYFETGALFFTPSLRTSPPGPMTLTAIERRTLRRIEADADGAVYEASDGSAGRVLLARAGEGWEVVEGLPPGGWRVYQRPAEATCALPLSIAGGSEPPVALEMVRTEQVEKTFR